jgi:heterodisulfide reductase subunit A2
MSEERRLGVYVCHCGGNISDYVDVASIVDQISDDADVVVARHTMFTCSDATQQEIVDDIKEQKLDGLVVASCSPKLHTFTFRGVASRAGLNPYQYTQVNVREQCSWAHTDDREGATTKALQLVRAGIGRTALTTPLDPVVVDTLPRGLVIGGGVAGMRAALGMADIGLHAYLVEREDALGGWLPQLSRMYPHDRDGQELARSLEEAVRAHPDITVLTNAQIVSKSGSFGNYRVGVQVVGQGGREETVEVEVGSIIVATGADTYSPREGEYGYGIDGVVTLPELEAMLARGGPLVYQDRPVHDIAYIYCVGSRTGEAAETQGPHRSNPSCSRYCCTATVNAALSVSDLAAPLNGTRAAGVHQYHLYRDLRTYGTFELISAKARERGSVFVKVDDEAPPTVVKDPGSARLLVTTKDLLSGGDEITLAVDLVVLVTGMVPRENDTLIQVLKLPLSASGFLHEIHPKLRPVETVVDGVYICGASQSPKTSSESVASALAAVTQAASILRRGTAELDPMVAAVKPEACTWCGACATACPYDAISQVSAHDGHQVAVIDPAGCKGCGGCIPLCPENAIDLRGYTDAQVTAMIDGMLKEPLP